MAKIIPSRREENSRYGGSSSRLTSAELRLEPIGTHTDVHDERDGELRRALHFLTDERRERIDFVWWGFEYQLVVHLKQHGRAERISPQRRRDARHRDLDEVRRRPLDW